MLELVEIKDQGQLQPFKKKNNFNRTKSFLDNNYETISFLNETGNGKKLTEDIHILKLCKKILSCHF